MRTRLRGGEQPHCSRVIGCRRCRVSWMQRGSKSLSWRMLCLNDSCKTNSHKRWLKDLKKIAWITKKIFSSIRIRWMLTDSRPNTERMKFSNWRSVWTCCSESWRMLNRRPNSNSNSIIRAALAASFLKTRAWWRRRVLISPRLFMRGRIPRRFTRRIVVRDASIIMSLRSRWICETTRKLGKKEVLRSTGNEFLERKSRSSRIHRPYFSNKNHLIQWAF